MGILADDLVIRNGEKGTQERVLGNSCQSGVFVDVVCAGDVCGYWIACSGPKGAKEWESPRTLGGFAVYHILMVHLYTGRCVEAVGHSGEWQSC